jgi:hypothetical protein
VMNCKSDEEGASGGNVLWGLYHNWYTSCMLEEKGKYSARICDTVATTPNGNIYYPKSSELNASRAEAWYVQLNVCGGLCGAIYMIICTS